MSLSGCVVELNFLSQKILYSYTFAYDLWKRNSYVGSIGRRVLWVKSGEIKEVVISDRD